MKTGQSYKGEKSDQKNQNRYHKDDDDDDDINISIMVIDSLGEGEDWK